MRARARTEVSAQLFCAASAFSRAIATSAEVALANSRSTSPVAGSTETTVLGAMEVTDMEFGHHYPLWEWKVKLVFDAHEIKALGGSGRAGGGTVFGFEDARNVGRRIGTLTDQEKCTH